MSSPYNNNTNIFVNDRTFWERQAQRRNRRENLEENKIRKEKFMKELELTIFNLKKNLSTMRENNSNRTGLMYKLRELQEELKNLKSGTTRRIPISNKQRQKSIKFIKSLGKVKSKRRRRRKTKKHTIKKKSKTKVNKRRK